jgi:hypothetical protein
MWLILLVVTLKRPEPKGFGLRTVTEAAPTGDTLDEDTAHGFGGRGEEVAAPVPVRLGIAADQAQRASWTNAVGCKVCPGAS